MNCYNNFSELFQNQKFYTINNSISYDQDGGYILCGVNDDRRGGLPLFLVENDLDGTSGVQKLNIEAFISDLASGVNHYDKDTGSVDHYTESKQNTDPIHLSKVCKTIIDNWLKNAAPDSKYDFKIYNNGDITITGPALPESAAKSLAKYLESQIDEFYSDSSN